MEAETVWRGLTGGESVHLADWPFLTDEESEKSTELGDVLKADDDLVPMDKVREVVSSTLSLRGLRRFAFASHWHSWDRCGRQC